MANYFENVKTLNDLKAEYRRLAMANHPDLGGSTAVMQEINAAYDQIKNGTAQQTAGQGYGAYGNYGGYGGQGSGYANQSYGWSSWGGPWGDWGDFAGARQTERSEYTAAKNYIRNGMYKEAVNALSGVPVSERDGKWYYLHAGANMYMGNKIAALESAKRAVEIEPGNEEYRRLLEQLQSGGDFYDNYTTQYSTGLSTDKLCLTMCALNACLGPSCGYHFFCC